MLQCGLRSAPKIFNAIADALEWCISNGGVEWIYHYLDDFTVLGLPGTEQCAQSLHTLQTVCRDLGGTISTGETGRPKYHTRIPRDYN